MSVSKIEDPNVLQISPPLDPGTIYQLLTVNLSSRIDGLENFPCPWIPTPDGKFLILNPDGFHYYIPQWLEFLIASFLSPQQYAVNGKLVLGSRSIFLVQGSTVVEVRDTGEQDSLANDVS